MAETSMLLLGWLLGIAGTPLADKLRSEYQKRMFLAALRNELSHMSLHLALTAFALAPEFPGFDRCDLERIRITLRRHQDSDLVAGPLAVVDLALEQPGEDMRRVLSGSSTSTAYYALKSQRLPFLESNWSLVGLLSFKHQQSLVEIANQVRIYNETVEEHRMFFGLTFDSSLSPEDRLIIEGNLATGGRSAVQRAVTVSDEISAFLAL